MRNFGVGSDRVEAVWAPLNNFEIGIYAASLELRGVCEIFLIKKVLVAHTYPGRR